MREILRDVIQGAIILIVIGTIFLVAELFGVSLTIPVVFLLAAWVIGWISRDLLEWELF